MWHRRFRRVEPLFTVVRWVTMQSFAFAPREMEKPMKKRLYRVAEVAEMLGCGRTTVYSEIKSGRLKSVHVAGCARVAEEDLDDYLEALRKA